MSRLSWRKSKRRTYQTGPDSYELWNDGTQLATVAPLKDGLQWYWYGFGYNSLANGRVFISIPDAKASALEMYKTVKPKVEA